MKYFEENNQSFFVNFEGLAHLLIPPIQVWDEYYGRYFLIDTKKYPYQQVFPGWPTFDDKRLTCGFLMKIDISRCFFSEQYQPILK